MHTHKHTNTQRQSHHNKKKKHTQTQTHTQTYQGRTAGRLIETYEKVGHSESQGTEALYNTNTNTSAPQIQCE